MQRVAMAMRLQRAVLCNASRHVVEGRWIQPHEERRQYYRKYHDDRQNKSHSYRHWFAAFTSVTLGFAYVDLKKENKVEVRDTKKDDTTSLSLSEEGTVPNADSDSASSSREYEIVVPEREDLPTFRMEEVKKHGKDAESIWVTFQGGVYDITEFIASHPGGEKILLGAGGPIDAYWALYNVHMNEAVADILETLRIGNLDPRDIAGEDELKDVDDPYRNEPKRHPAMLVNSRKPFNAETPSALLMDSFRTPNSVFFIRHHMPVPVIDLENYKVQIEGIGLDKPVNFSVDELKTKFKETYVTATLQCAGNRRADMAKYKRVQGLNWTGTAIGNAKWTGVRLRDVLLSIGVDPDDKRIKHVQLEGCDSDEGTHYGVSISFEKAMRPEVVLAYKMNDEPLPREHGQPLRLIAPGIVGARNVKWLKRIILSDQESHAQWQRKDYKALPPSVALTDAPDFDKTPAIQEYPVQSAFCMPVDGAKVNRSDGEVEVAGYAWSGGGRGIIRVDISPDGGETWQLAELEQDPEQDLDHMWAWTFFRATVKIPEGVDHLDLVCKATDRAYNSQPETPKGIWNVRGLIHNAWHHVRVNIVDDE